MIEIKNKLSNSKKRKSQIRFNNYMKLKKQIRMKFQTIIPLTQQEKYMYKENRFLDKSLLKPDDGKYYRLNKKIHLLSVISKDELKNFNIGIQTMFRENPDKSEYRRTIVDNRLERNILKYEGSSNNQGWTCLGAFTPKDENLKSIVDGIDILMFSFSSDYMGISFEINLTNKFNDFFNEKLIDEVSNKENYSTYYVGSKKFTSRNYTSGEILRKREIDDILVEIKMRCYTFINKYINLLQIFDKAPISLDEFVTNYNYEQEPNQFLMYYDVYNYKSNGNLQVIYESTYKEYQQEYKVEQFCFNCIEKKEDINRSSKFIIKTKDNYQENFIIQSDLVNYFIITLQYYITNELDSIVATERKMLSPMYNLKVKKLYKNYNKISREISRYRMILDGILINKFDELCDCKKLEKNSRYENSRKNRLFEKHNMIEKEFSNSLTIRNYKSSSFLSKISIIIAIISIIITTIFSILNYCQNNNKRHVPNQKYSISKIIINT